MFIRHARWPDRSITLLHLFAAYFIFVAMSAITTSAAEMTFTVNPNLSGINVGGTFLGAPLQQQVVTTASDPPNYQSVMYYGFEDYYCGTINVDADTSANTVQIVGGAVSAQQNASYLGPQFNFAPAAYGIYNGGDPSVNTEFLAAIRDFSLSFTSTAISSPSDFDASQVSGSITSGELDYSFTSDFTEPPEIDSSSEISGGLSLASAPASILDQDGVETLYLPVNTDFTIDVGDPSISSGLLYLDMDLTGVIEATPSVPEPTSIFLVAGSIFVLVLRGTRKRAISRCH